MKIRNGCTFIPMKQNKYMNVTLQYGFFRPHTVLYLVQRKIPDNEGAVHMKVVVIQSLSRCRGLNCPSRHWHFGDHTTFLLA